MPAISCSAPGKIILCGEHAVVYGEPAIAVPVLDVKTKTSIFARPSPGNAGVKLYAPEANIENDLDNIPTGNPLAVAIRSTLQLIGTDHMPSCEIRISSTLPIGAGMGSSASTTVSLVRAVAAFMGYEISDEEVNKIAFEVEKIHHGTPSGIDNTVITYAKPILYQKGTPLRPLSIPVPFTLVIADSGLRTSTAESVAGVRQRWQREPEKFEEIFKNIGEIVEKVRHHLENGAVEPVGPLLTKNHWYLEQIGVSCSKTDLLVNTAINAGAMGAKVSGGGLGGNIIALADPLMSVQIASALEQAGAVRTIITRVTNMRGSGNE